MAGDFDTPCPALAHRSGYGAVTVEDVLARVGRLEGHGLTPAEVRVLAAEVERLRAALAASYRSAE